MSQYDKEPTCPFCKETTLSPNEYHSGLKISEKNIAGQTILLIYCSNCGAILGTVKK